MWSGKCPVGEMSVRENVLVGKCPVGEVSFGELPVRGIVRSGKCPSREFPSGKCQSRNCARGSVSRGTVQSGNCLVGELSAYQMKYTLSLHATLLLATQGCNWQKFKQNLSNTLRLNIWQTYPKISLSLSLRLYDWL